MGSDGGAALALISQIGIYDLETRTIVGRMVVVSMRVVLFLLLVVSRADSWWFWGSKKGPKPKPPPPTPPPPVDCTVGDWGDWTSCNATCGLGTMTRTRKKLVVERNGGVCTHVLNQNQTCYGGQCCSVK